MKPVQINMIAKEYVEPEWLTRLSRAVAQATASLPTCVEAERNLRKAMGRPMDGTPVEQ